MKPPCWPAPWVTHSGLSIWDADGHIVAEVAMRGTEAERIVIGNFIVRAVNSYAASQADGETQ